MRASRRGKVRTEILGVWPSGRVSRVYRTPYTAGRLPRLKARARGGIKAHPLPEGVRANRDIQTAATIERLDRMNAGLISSAEADREYNELSDAHYAIEMRTREGLRYYAAIFRVARRNRRNAHKEGALIKADRRDHTRLPALRAAYARRH